MNIAKGNLIRICDCGRGFETRDQYNFHKQDCPIERYKQRVAEAIDKVFPSCDCKFTQIAIPDDVCDRCKLLRELGTGTTEKEVKG